MLVENGIDVSVINKDNVNAYMKALAFGELGAAEAIWKAGGDLNPDQLSIGATTLMYTAKVAKNAKVLDKLIMPRTLEEKDKSGRTALFYAAAVNKNYDIVQTLLDAGANPNARSINGDTPLIIAAKTSTTPNVILILLLSGAKMDTKNKAGKTAFDYAKQESRHFKNA